MATWAWNFRASSAYVTDGANETYWLGEAYPTTRNGRTAGFTTDLSANARDRDNTLDRRIAGCIFQSNNGTQNIFRVDLNAAGDIDVRIALGDSGSDLNAPYLQVRDGSTPLFTIDDSIAAIANHNYVDATDTIWTDVTWPTSNVAKRVTLTGTVLNFALGTNFVGSNLSMLAHILVSEVPATTRPRGNPAMAIQQRAA
jgi:hypothetical protein